MKWRRKKRWKCTLRHRYMWRTFYSFHLDEKSRLGCINISIRWCAIIRFLSHWCIHRWRWHIISYLTHSIEIQEISMGWCTNQRSCKVDYKNEHQQFENQHTIDAPFSHHHQFNSFDKFDFVINQNHLLVFAHHHHCVVCGSFSTVSRPMHVVLCCVLFVVVVGRIFFPFPFMRFAKWHLHAEKSDAHIWMHNSM